MRGKGQQERGKLRREKQGGSGRAWVHMVGKQIVGEAEEEVSDILIQIQKKKKNQQRRQNISDTAVRLGNVFKHNTPSAHKHVEVPNPGNKFITTGNFRDCQR